MNALIGSMLLLFSGLALANTTTICDANGRCRTVIIIDGGSDSTAPPVLIQTLGDNNGAF